MAELSRTSVVCSRCPYPSYKDERVIYCPVCFKKFDSRRQDNKVPENTSDIKRSIKAVER